MRRRSVLGGSLHSPVSGRCIWLAHRRAQRGAENTPRAFLISTRARAEYAGQLDAEYDGLLVFRVPAPHTIATAALRGVQRLVRANLEHLREIVRRARELGVQR